MDEREDSKILRRRDEEHVSIFKARVGMGAVIMEGQEIGAVVRYIEALERDAARRTTPDREAISDHDAEGLEIIAGWLDKDGLVEPAAMLRRIAGRPTAPTSDKGGA